MALHTVQEVTTLLAGVGVTWRTDCVSEADELRRVLKYHLRSPGDLPPGDRHSVTFRQVDKPVSVPGGAALVWEGPYIVLASGDNKVKWLRTPSDARDYLVLSDEITVIHDPAAHTTECLLLSRPDGDRWVRPRIWDALVIMIHTIMAMYGRYSVHSAAVGFDGRAYLFLGETGHGKSTLCTDFLNLGADFMGDDLTFLYIHEGRVMVGSLLLDAKLFPHRWSRNKDWIDVVSRFGCKAPTSLPLGRIYYLQRARGKCRTVPAEPIECIVRLIAGCNNVRMQYNPGLWQDTLQAVADNHPFGYFLFGDRKTLDKSLLDA